MSPERRSRPLRANDGGDVPWPLALLLAIALVPLETKLYIVRLLYIPYPGYTRPTSYIPARINPHTKGLSEINTLVLHLLSFLYFSILSLVWRLQNGTESVIS
ncbi:MAG: hypothetical protein ACI906_002564 [Candidatus Latescibacterota bacterium]|jgi:hypothetical protein